MGIKFTKSVILNQIKEISPKKNKVSNRASPPAWSCIAMLEDCHAMLCLTVPDKKWVGIKFIKARKGMQSYANGKKLFELLMK